jgi:hypothetical protein
VLFPDQGYLIMQLFFDVVGPRSRLYDYHGQYCENLENAAGVAELVATDLGMSETDDWGGAQVEVTSAAGKILFSIPILEAA